MGPRIKVQDTLLKAIAKKLQRGSAAETIGVSDRTMRRYREHPGGGGYSGLTQLSELRIPDRLRLWIAEESRAKPSGGDIVNQSPALALSTSSTLPAAASSFPWAAGPFAETPISSGSSLRISPG